MTESWTYGDIMEMRHAIDGANGTLDGFAFVTSPAGAEHLKTVEDGTGVYAWNHLSGRMLGLPVRIRMDLDSSACLYLMPDPGEAACSSSQ